ncbi:hypothetical protein F5Y17DRAFT_372663 [Xylariaceae sp. FL0594]|nr:hypothetical protein F5Y17DRAFT_372663 [Xylariaceae sp. FL0594]
MSSPLSASRGKGRGSARKRQVHTTDASSQPDIPVPKVISTVESIENVETVEQTPSEPPSSSTGAYSFSFETPSPSASRGTRSRARAVEGAMPPSSDDLDSKGGRSLRKRTRVDYANFEHAAEDISSDGNKTTPSAARAARRRRADTDSDEEATATHTKRRSSEQLPPSSSSSRRRSHARKSTPEPSTGVSDQHAKGVEAKDVEVQDTIEVGGRRRSQSEAATLGRTSSTSSRRSSHNNPQQPELTDPFDSPLDVPPSQFDYLTPYIPGVFVKYPSAPPEAESASQQLQQDAEEVADEQLDGTKPDSAMADAPVAGCDVQDSTPVDAAGVPDETPAVSPAPLDTTANSSSAEAEVPYIPPPPPPQSISFRQTRDASEFTSLFDNYKSLTPEEAYARLEAVNRAMVAWQYEYNDLRKLTDDENNAVRYRQEEVTFQHRYKMAVSKDPKANPLRKDFVVRGIRAPRPDPEVEYARYQDKLMAANWGFEYDDNVNKIGFQDPLAQRAGAGKGRLRERPKQTAKAAEADDGTIVQGKRQRKPPTVYNGVEAASRASTPAAPQRRRRRNELPAAEDAHDANPAAPPAAAATSSEQAAPKRKGRGGRPRKYPLPAPVAGIPTASPPAEDVQPPSDQPKEEGVGRKRRRGKPATESAEPTEPTELTEGVKNETPATNGIGQHTLAKDASRRTNNISRMSEVPSGSFYTSSMRSSNPEDDARPATSSSAATEYTVTPNNYQLREKRQRKFSLNPTEVGDEEPNSKRVKRTKKAQAEVGSAADLPAPSSVSPSSQPPVGEPHNGSKPPTKIKLKNYHGQAPGAARSSGTPTPPLNGNGITNGAANASETTDTKDYNQMTKSEKMSHSMKARWASGSMTGAVEKRRATLANKKQAVKAAEPNHQPLEAIPAATAQH